MLLNYFISLISRVVANKVKLIIDAAITIGSKCKIFLHDITSKLMLIYQIPTYCHQNITWCLVNKNGENLKSENGGEKENLLSWCVEKMR